MRPGALVRAGIVALMAVPAASAQTRPTRRWTATRYESLALAAVRPTLSGDGAAGASMVALAASRDAMKPAPWWAPIASAVIPGSGQALQRKRRAIAYLAADGYLLAQYASAARDGRTGRKEYQRLARIARAFYTARFPTGDFEYYERMEQYVESGAFDLNPGGELEPETDTLTFNGQTWRLARETFWEDPSVPPARESDAYRRAIDFYARRAVATEFRWSWRNAQLEQDLFRRTIARSNGAFRTSSEYLGMMIANHALSAVDAFIVIRLGRSVGPDRQYRLSARLPWTPFESRPRVRDPR